MTFNFFMQNLVNALQWGSFYALIALGYSMVYSILMLFNFAHGDIFHGGRLYRAWRFTGTAVPVRYGRGGHFTRLAGVGTGAVDLHVPDRLCGDYRRAGGVSAPA
jgi:branched-subunit amino acid ABC-type transport system permease component